jgi:hypothetical protein
MKFKGWDVETRDQCGWKIENKQEEENGLGKVEKGQNK